MKRFLVAAALALAASATIAAAQACGGVYTVERGDSLSLIADRQYKNATKWTEVHRNNLSTIGKNPNALRVGMELRLGCINGLPVGLARSDKNHRSGDRDRRDNPNATEAGAVH